MLVTLTVCFAMTLASTYGTENHIDPMRGIDYDSLADELSSGVNHY